MITAGSFAGKKYAVYGLARSGLATAEALLASGASVSIWDAREEARANAPQGSEVANLDEVDLGGFDSLVVTPGLPLNRHPIARRARTAGVEIIGDIELFARARPELPPHKVVGITGTNGKSTTTALVHHILRTAGLPTGIGGNIGLPILAQDPLSPGGIYVLELSSYQIDLTQSLDCDVAALLNITPDHLERYASFEAYAQSKLRLFEMQSSTGVRVINPEDSEAYAAAKLLDERTGTSSKWATPSDAMFNRWPTLPGWHNVQNICAATAIVRALGITDEQIGVALDSYPGLPHRMERIREKDGVLFVNDSKATNPTAAAPALAAFERIRWICGGRPKTDELEECAPYLAHVATAYTIGEAADLFERLLSPHIPVENCGKLEVAVREAATDAKAGDTVLLSPACASFDQFRDFEDRGEQFRALVGEL